ncbi:hypothetical protein Ciccas_013614 [Cichlidogyrus casuarinus]|uniref:Uncharacterized protein n=1 Tax=Cichlidogyrus casuarinus TaxID=1844966 RepID=A0ABD2PK48_9PLAT
MMKNTFASLFVIVALVLVAGLNTMAEAKPAGYYGVGYHGAGYYGYGYGYPHAAGYGLGYPYYRYGKGIYY